MNNNKCAERKKIGNKREEKGTESNIDYVFNLLHYIYNDEEWGPE